MSLSRGNPPTKELPGRFKFSRGMHMPVVTPLAASRTPMPQVPSLNLVRTPPGSARTLSAAQAPANATESASPVPARPEGQTQAVSVPTPRSAKSTHTPRSARMSQPRQKDYVDRVVESITQDHTQREEMEEALSTPRLGRTLNGAFQAPQVSATGEGVPQGDVYGGDAKGEETPSQPAPRSSTMIWLEETRKRVTVRRTEAQRRHLDVMRRIERLGQVALHSTLPLEEEEAYQAQRSSILLAEEEAEAEAESRRQGSQVAAALARAEDQEYDEDALNATLKLLRPEEASAESKVAGGGGGANSDCSSHSSRARQNTLVLLDKAQAAHPPRASAASSSAQNHESPPFQSVTHHHNSLAEENDILKRIGESGIFSDDEAFSPILSPKQGPRDGATAGGTTVPGRAPSLDKGDMSPPAQRRGRSFDL